MAKPRIFISSTYYDLKHVRSSLDNFIESLGFEPVLSEKGDIAYAPDLALDESCYREARNVDIFVLIIGGRYGSAATDENVKPTPEFYDRYNSITKKEYEAATGEETPAYILIEANVYSEFQTYRRNKDRTDIHYAHVDSVNIFKLIDDILAKPRNNPVHTFERFSDIESWLREQWSGLFRELLQRMSSHQQIASLSSQVEALGAINKTLQTYLEAVVAKVSPDDAARLIENERQRLSVYEQVEQLRRSEFYQLLLKPGGIKPSDFRDALLHSDSVADFSHSISMIARSEFLASAGVFLPVSESREAQGHLNECRAIVGKPPYPPPDAEEN